MEKKHIIDQYIDYQNKYVQEFGKNTLVLMEVGSFFEIYGINNENTKIGNVKDVCNILNIQMTRKNKSILENNKKNHHHRYLNVTNT